MKKVFLSLLGLAAVLCVACGSNKAIDQQKALLNSGIVKIDSITTMEQFQAYQQEFAAAQAAFATENAEALQAEISAEDATAISELSATWSSKMQAKGDSLVAAQAAADTAAIAAALAAEVAAATAVVKK